MFIDRDEYLSPEEDLETALSRLRALFFDEAKQRRYCEIRMNRALKMYERVNNRNTTLINAHNGMIGRINVAAGILEDMLDNKPKHMLARDANGKVMGSDREALLRVLSCLKIEPKKSDDDEEVSV